MVGIQKVGSGEGVASGIGVIIDNKVSVDGVCNAVANGLRGVAVTAWVVVVVDWIGLDRMSSGFDAKLLQDTNKAAIKAKMNGLCKVLIFFNPFGCFVRG